MPLHRKIDVPRKMEGIAIFPQFAYILPPKT